MRASVSRAALAAVFVGAGIAHFLWPLSFAALIPPFLPRPLLLVAISGVLEISFGLLLLLPRTRRWAAWGLVALLIGVYPANIYHALSGGLTDANLPEIFSNSAVAWARLPFQFVLLAWAYRHTQRSPA